MFMQQSKFLIKSLIVAMQQLTSVGAIQLLFPGCIG